MIEKELYIYMNNYYSTILGLGKRNLIKEEYNFSKLLIVNYGKHKQMGTLSVPDYLRENKESDRRKGSQRT